MQCLTPTQKNKFAHVLDYFYVHVQNDNMPTSDVKLQSPSFLMIPIYYKLNLGDLTMFMVIFGRVITAQKLLFINPYGILTTPLESAC